MFFSLIMYKVRVVKETGGRRLGFFASVGLFIGVLAPGCAACGIGLLSLLGLSAAFLTFLPYDGLELSIFAVGIMAIVIFKMSDNLTICKIRKTKNG